MATTEMEAERRNKTTLAFGENYLEGAAGLSLILLPLPRSCTRHAMPCWKRTTPSATPT